MIQYGHTALSGDGEWSGCYATHIILRRNSTILPLPDSIPDTVAAPINCALATAVNAVQSVSKDKVQGKSALVQVRWKIR